MTLADLKDLSRDSGDNKFFYLVISEVYQF